MQRADLVAIAVGLVLGAGLAALILHGDDVPTCKFEHAPAGDRVCISPGNNIRYHWTTP